MSKKNFIPQKRLNPAELKLRMDRLNSIIEAQDKAIQALSKSHDNHISYLGNFARHDIKNCIQSMDSILSTTDLHEYKQGHIDSLVTNLDIIRDTLENFSRLVPYSVDKKFSLHSLIVAVELISRTDIYANKINFTKNYIKESEDNLSVPFQSMLQMVNNLIINAIKSLEGIDNPKIHLEAFINDDFLTLEVSDNGIEIAAKSQRKVFDFGYSTTGESGIGLYHAKYLCDLFHGKIELLNEKKADNFTKTFKITLPFEA
jgi:signal transduction histidine kinase